MERALRILHIEDEPLDTELVVALLRREGLPAEIDRVDSLAGFTAALERGGYALILSDYTMPGMDSLEALRLARERCPGVPFVFVSGTLGEDVAIETLKQGATDYVLKQRLGRLGPAVQRALAEAEERARRKGVEADLRTNEERLRLQSTALQSAANAISITDREGTIQWVNPAFERLTGYSAAELLGQNHRLLKSGKQDAAFYKRLWDTILTGLPWHGEMINKRKDGSLYYEETTIAPVTDARGGISHFIAIKQDVTRRKRAEEQLQQSEESHRIAAEELRAIMGATPAGILVAHDPEGHLITGNRPAHEVLGVPLGEENISAAPRAQEFSPYFRIYRQGREARSEELPMQVAGATGAIVRDQELEVVRRDGTRRTVLVTAAPLYSADGRIRGAVGALVDISDRKQAEQALQASEQRLRWALQAARGGAWELDLTTGEAWWSPEMYELWSIAPGTPMRLDNALAHVPEPDRERLQAAIAEAIARHTDYRCEFRLQHPERGERWMAGAGRPVYDESGRAVRMFGLTLDITERKQAESALQAAKEELARANEELERKVEERTARLHEAMAEMEQISYSMIHDLRAPLRAIQSFGGILAEDPETRLSDESRDLVAKMRTATGRMDNLVCDVLNYSKVVRGHLPLGPVDLGALARGILETYPHLQPAQAEVSLAPDLPVVLGNAAALTQCLSQLLSNAVKFTRPGIPPQVRIWAQPVPGPASRSQAQENPTGDTQSEPARSSPVTRRSRRSQGKAEQRSPSTWVRIVVEDNGIGIAPELQGKVFGMFQRLSNRGEGTGMGLAIVKKAVERMGGRVGVESEPGRGSKFWVELHLAQSHS